MAVDENYFDIAEIEDSVLYGRLLNRKDIINKMPYVVLREDIAKQLFGRSNVVGQILDVDNHEFKVIGITEYLEEDYSEYLQTEDSLGSLGELFKDKFKNLQK